MADFNPSEGGSYILDPKTGRRTLVERGGSEPMPETTAPIAEPVVEPAPISPPVVDPDPTDPTTDDAPASTSKRKGA